jgi:hypothetical protein
MGPILIIGRSDDQACRLVESKVRQYGRQVFYLAEDQVLPGLEIAWEPAEPGARKLGFGHLGRPGEWRVELEAIDGIFCRSFGVPVSPAEFATKDGQYVSAEWFALVMGWTNRANCTVINRLQPALWYKLRLIPADLLAVAPRSGFRLPHTIVTTRVEDVRAFCASRPRGAAYSPLTEPARFPLSETEDMDRLFSLGETLPFHVVETPAGEQIDVLVAGDSVFEVDSQGDVNETSSPVLAAKCRELGKTLGLRFMQLSLVTEREEWFCLEVNRHPTLVQCNARGQNKVADAVVEMLLSEVRQ